MQFLKGKGFSKAEIVRSTCLDWKTVKKYMNMSEPEFIKYLEKVRYRTRSFEPFKDQIILIYALNGFKPLQKSSVYDRLEEIHEGRLPGTERTFRDFIDYLLETEQLILSGGSRPYTPVPELPLGQQMQADFGEFRCPSGLKLYIFAAVLSASRYRYCAFQERPFTTLDTIRHFLDCFQYYGGIPEELVIDQDRTMIVSENSGDIICTSEFTAFLEEMDLRLFVCRKSDPETKGKVENLVKFVKKNFLGARDFTDLSEARQGLRKWLERRANGKMSAAIKRVPAAMFEEERKHLKPLRKSIFQENAVPGKEDRSVDKMCLISVDAIQYPVPGKYKKKSVDILRNGNTVSVFDPQTGVLIVEHPVPLVGTKVYAKKENTGKTEKSEQMLSELFQKFPLDEWREFVRKNRERYPRYLRDQYHDAERKFSGEISMDCLMEALNHCLENDTLSMAQLDDTYRYFKREKEGAVSEPQVHKLLPVSSRTLELINGLRVAKRDISFYQAIAGQRKEAVQ
ncbi:MAG: IS21 family transposase [Candidatus Wallbacteria bacterium]|nr:IS21 family transposase [Candidatus Wallbacteria bacterium]